MPMFDWLGRAEFPLLPGQALTRRAAYLRPLSLTSRGALVCWKSTAVTVAVRPAPALFSFAKPISVLAGGPTTDSTTLVASSLLSGA